MPYPSTAHVGRAGGVYPDGVAVMVCDVVYVVVPDLAFTQLPEPYTFLY